MIKFEQLNELIGILDSNANKEETLFIKHYNEVIEELPRDYFYDGDRFFEGLDIAGAKASKEMTKIRRAIYERIKHDLPEELLIL